MGDGVAAADGVHARARLRGLRLVATDTEWSVSDGDLVEGPVEALLLLLTGRTAWLGRLSVQGSAGSPRQGTEPRSGRVST